jgi:hypothetical protein
MTKAGLKLEEVVEEEDLCEISSLQSAPYLSN